MLTRINNVYACPTRVTPEDTIDEKWYENVQVREKSLVPIHFAKDLLPAERFLFGDCQRDPSRVHFPIPLADLMVKIVQSEWWSSPTSKCKIKWYWCRVASDWSRWVFARLAVVFERCASKMQCWMSDWWWFKRSDCEYGETIHSLIAVSRASSPDASCVLYRGTWDVQMIEWEEVWESGTWSLDKDRSWLIDRGWCSYSNLKDASVLELDNFSIRRSCNNGVEIILCEFGELRIFEKVSVVVNSRDLVSQKREMIARFNKDSIA